ncbi:MAG: VCBS repeat-containing protein [Lentisphaeraceae bacterium]|nr:VCBS repeat-containing protein [Lentisphaeraceae bacterium]
MKIKKLLLLFIALTVVINAENIEFKIKRIGVFRSEACGVGDFNNDGKLDIIAGPYWYEAPNWQAHKYRELRGSVDDKGKGYFDDFMNIPMDVDGDGKLDVVTCSWFAQQLDWYKNTGDLTPWPMTIIDKSGNYESGDLWDVDGDGLEHEILPVAKRTHWFELSKKNNKAGFIKHEVSSEKSVWGMGCGDINGDGRPDIIRPNIWFEAPEDPRNGQWKTHPISLGTLEKNTPKHTPQIWVYDVNADGKNDLITSDAHGYGLFWYEQDLQNGKISWKQHIIDKSWSQVHSINLKDLDGDGDLDIIAGKRFHAHNGKDDGATEPLGVYWYELNRGKQPKWHKHILSYAEGIGSGLSIPVVDLDGDGDLDIIVTGKWGGPVIFENQTKKNKSPK